MSINSAPVALTFYKQFVVYRTQPSTTRPGKTDKITCHPQTGRNHDAHDPAIWLDFETAQATATAWGAPYGVGFVFTDADPFWFIDIDGALVDGQWSPIAQQLCQL